MILMPEQPWPHSSPSDPRWRFNVPADGTYDQPFRMGLRRGVLEQLRLRGVHHQQGLDLVLQAIRSLAAMQRTGPALTHQWVHAARHHEASWSAIAAALRISKQTAHQRFTRPAAATDPLSSQALWASVQVARDLHADTWSRPPGADPNPWWSELKGAWWPWGSPRNPPRDLADLAVLRLVLVCTQQELAWLVAEARFQGVEWRVIGRALGGVSRQAAHKQFCTPVRAILAARQAS